MSTSLPVQFRCPQCQKPLRADKGGQPLFCPNCEGHVPTLLSGPVQLDTAGTVPLSLTLPNGSVQFAVTQKTADDLAKFAWGGLLAAAGMVLWMVLTGGRGKSWSSWPPS